MRLFTALDVPDEIRERLAELLRGLKPSARIHWSPLANLHVTTKFIGAWEAGDLPKLMTALAAVPKTGPLEIAIRGLGWFPTPHSPRVFFAGIAAPPELASLALSTDKACVSIGVPGETKKFTPHLTLARIKTPEPLQNLRKAVAELESQEFGAFTATSFYLYESVPGERASMYRKLEEFPLS